MEPQAATPPAPATAPKAVTAAGPLGAYERWFNAHTGVARNMETMLYIAPQLVPKTAVPPEVATQFSYSLVGLLHLYHDYIVYKNTNPEADAKPTPTDRLTRMVRVPLSLISHVQVLAEVVANKVGGDAGKWRVIVWIELVKSACRLFLLLQQRRAMLLRGAKYKGVDSTPRESAFARFTKSKDKRGARTGKTFSKPAVEEKTTPEEPAAPPNTISFQDPAFHVDSAVREELLVGGEFLHILRPTAYAILRQRSDENSWLPVVVAFILEASGILMSTAAVKPLEASSKPNVKKAQEEIRARKMALLLYLLRDPVYNSVTIPAAEKVCDMVDYVPLVGKAFRFLAIKGTAYYHQFHFYTSAS